MSVIDLLAQCSAIGRMKSITFEEAHLKASLISVEWKVLQQEELRNLDLNIHVTMEGS